MVDIIKGVKEIMDKKDPASGSRGGLLTGITKGVNEVLDNTLNKIGTFGAPGRNYALLGQEGRNGGGIKEYQMNRDLTEAAGRGFVDVPFDLTDLNPVTAILRRQTAANDAAANARRLWDTDLRGLATVRLNSVLEERSYVDFYFPNLGIGDQGRRRVAFFENPSIRENRLANYATQNIVARNEPARLYVGSGPRKLTLDFTFTLPHVEYFFKLCYQASLLGFKSIGNSSEGREQFEGRSPAAYWSDWQNFTAAYLQKFFGAQFKAAPGGDPGTPSRLGTIRNGTPRPGASRGPFVENRGVKGPRFYEPTFQEPKDGYQFANKEDANNEIRHLQTLSKDSEFLGKESMSMMATYYTQFVIDTVRASVVGDDVKGSRVGPPILRFRHGTLFNESPFIVKSFNITYPTDKGYEYRTLVPRQVKFSLSLEEFHQVHGSHHGDTAKEQVPDATDILDLKLPL
jgi:hypothetical protein